MSKFYIGVTQEDIHLRLKKHKDGIYGSHRFTSMADDWELFLFIECIDYAHAVRMEKKIKSMKSSVYIRNLAKYPELRDKLYLQTSQSI